MYLQGELLMSTKRKLFTALIITASVIICSGCSNSNADLDLYYDAFNQKVVSYDSNTGNVEPLIKEDNRFQYMADADRSIYFDGNSVTNGFQIIKVSDNAVEKLYSFDKNEAAIPFGTVADEIYFVHMFYDEKGKENEQDRCIGSYNINDNSITDYPQLKGLIDHGDVGKNTLYYTVYDEQNDNYSMMSLDVAEKPTDQVPACIMKDLKDGAVIAYSEGCFYSKEDQIVCDKQKYQREAVNMIEGDTLIQFFVSDRSTPMLRMTNLKNKKVEQIDDVHGIRFVDGKIEVLE
jgi:hypothetical protein